MKSEDSFLNKVQPIQEAKQAYEEPKRMVYVCYKSLSGKKCKLQNEEYIILDFDNEYLIGLTKLDAKQLIEILNKLV